MKNTNVTDENLVKESDKKVINNTKINKIKDLVKHPSKFIIFIIDRKPFHFLSDKIYLKIKYRILMGEKLNLEDPKTFDEKLQWLKLYNRKPEYTTMVDKYEVKEYISKTIGKEYVIPTIGIYERFDDINFSKLPNRFVIKCTHDSGGLVICKDKTKFDIKSARKKISKSLKRNYYYIGREWPYKNVKPRILIEKYMEDKKDEELRDYKFYCFDGYVKALMVATNRQSDTEELCFDYFDNKYNHLNLTNHWHPNAKIIPHKPNQFEKMIKLAEKLSRGFPHIRVDFYEVNNKIYFGELTFYDMGGYLKIHPDDWNLEWGNLIDLSNIKK